MAVRLAGSQVVQLLIALQNVQVYTTDTSQKLPDLLKRRGPRCIHVDHHHSVINPFNPAETPLLLDKAITCTIFLIVIKYQKSLIIYQSDIWRR